MLMLGNSRVLSGPGRSSESSFIEITFEISHLLCLRHVAQMQQKLTTYLAMVILKIFTPLGTASLMF